MFFKGILEYQERKQEHISKNMNKCNSFSLSSFLNYLITKAKIITPCDMALYVEEKFKTFVLQWGGQRI